MFLAIDIGNTNITFGLIGKGKPIKEFKIPTGDILLKRAKAIRRLRQFKKISLQDIVICSVAPRATKKLTSILRKFYPKKPIIIGKDIRVPLVNLYRRPAEVGQDRLVGAYAATRIYQCPLIIIDFGTAITFDAISRNNEYLGGIIIPGIEMSLDSLYKKAALLPKVKFRRPAKSVIGNNTTDSILSGIFYGYASLCDGLVSKIKKKIGRARVVATGGHVKLMRKYCKSIDEVEEKLMLKGLAFLYSKKITK